jgi:hypothetical protein
MQRAWAEVYQSFRPMATCGSLPCIRELQDAGFDVQVGARGAEGRCGGPMELEGREGRCATGSRHCAGCSCGWRRALQVLTAAAWAAGAPQMMGFGAMDVYHANNEYCSLAAFGKGMRLLAKLVQVLQ